MNEIMVSVLFLVLVLLTASLPFEAKENKASRKKIIYLSKQDIEILKRLKGMSDMYGATVFYYEGDLYDEEKKEFSTKEQKIEDKLSDEARSIRHFEHYYDIREIEK